MLKNIDPMEVATYNIGRISGGTAPGIIAGYAEIEGMMRNVRNETRGILRERMEKIALGIAESFGGHAEFEFFEGYSGVHNDPSLTDFVADMIESCKGDWLRGINDDMAARDDVLVR